MVELQGRLPPDTDTFKQAYADFAVCTDYISAWDCLTASTTGLETQHASRRHPASSG